MDRINEWLRRDTLMLGVLIAAVWLFFLLCVLSCKVTKRTTDIQQSHVVKKDSSQVAVAAASDQQIYASQTSDSGYYFSLVARGDRTPFRAGETTDEYAAENASVIHKYGFRRRDTAAHTRLKTASWTTTVRTDDSTGKKKVTYHAHDSTAVANFKFPWWWFVLVIAIIILLIFLRRSKR